MQTLIGDPDAQNHSGTMSLEGFGSRPDKVPSQRPNPVAEA